jgi:hypothetical protein
MDYFPEPTIPDESWSVWDETMVEWLTRSSHPRARAVREFINRSLSCFPPKYANSLSKKLLGDFQSHLFEVIVGRYLQVLGADIEPEPLGTNDTRIDFRATFSDGVLASVECVSKQFNQKAQRTMAHHQNMAGVLEAIPFPKGTKPNHFGPVVSFMDNSIERLRYALKDFQKRKQAVGAVPPVFLAIDCPFHGPDSEDFDQALFGQTVDHRDFHSGKSLGITFNPDGLFVADKGIPFAGVLAFLKLSMVGGADPVLYLNPYQRWKLPAALASHETRVWTSGIKRTAATREPVINLLRFVEYNETE